VVSFMPRPLYPQGKSHFYPLDRRLGGPQNRPGRGGEEEVHKLYASPNIIRVIKSRRMRMAGYVARMGELR
jgi:hypothetical protein